MWKVKWNEAEEKERKVEEEEEAGGQAVSRGKSRTVHKKAKRQSYAQYRAVRVCVLCWFFSVFVFSCFMCNFPYLYTARSESCVLFVECYRRSRRRLRRHTSTSDVVSCVCVSIDVSVSTIHTKFQFQIRTDRQKIKTNNKNVENKLSTVLSHLPAKCWENTHHTHRWCTHIDSHEKFPLFSPNSQSANTMSIHKKKIRENRNETYSTTHTLALAHNRPFIWFIHVYADVKLVSLRG